MANPESEVFLAVKIWAAAAWADGVIADEEAESMRMVIGMAKLTDEEREAGLAMLENKVELDDIDVSSLAEDDRLNIYSATLGVITVDNKVVATELAFLDRLRAALGIDEDKAAELHERAGL